LALAAAVGLSGPAVAADWEVGGGADAMTDAVGMVARVEGADGSLVVGCTDGRLGILVNFDSFLGRLRSQPTRKFMYRVDLSAPLSSNRSYGDDYVLIGGEDAVVLASQLRLATLFRARAWTLTDRQVDLAIEVGGGAGAIDKVLDACGY